MLICRGDGELLVNPVNGEVVWETECSPGLSWSKQNGYKSVATVEGALNLDPHELPLPACKECPEYKHCCDGLDSDSDEPDNIFCMAIDENATGKSILAALSKLDEEERNEILRYQVE